MANRSDNPSPSTTKRGKTPIVEIQEEMLFMEGLPLLPPATTSLAGLEAEIDKPAPAAHDDEVPALPPAPPGAAQVKLQLFGRPDDDLAMLARRHFEKMENNPHFPRPLPSQIELERLLEDFAQDCKDTRNAMNHVRMLVAQKVRSRRKLEQALNRRGHYVQAESRGDPTAILSSAFEIRRKRRTIESLDPPENLQVTPAAESGSVILTWSKVSHAKLYRLEFGPVDGPRQEIPLTGRRRRILTGLAVGAVHSFRIASIGGATGQSDWSAPVERMIA